MKTKQCKRIVTITLLLVLTLIMMNSVLAWGVAPARQHAKNTQTTQELSVNLINDQGDSGYFKVSFAGSLAKYAKYEGEMIYLLSDQGEVKVPFKLTLPKSMEPGRNSLGIVLEQATSGSTNTVGASLTLVAEVIVTIPIEGGYVNADVVVSKASQSQPVPITISLFNTGTMTLPVWAEINIKGPTNDIIKTITTEKKILEVGQSTKFAEFWTGETRQGSYAAEITLHYGDEFKIITKQFTVQGDKVESESISSDDFKLGGIVPINIGIKNNWNTKIEGVYSEVFVLTKEGALVQKFKSGPEDVLARGKGVLSAYWDTTKLVVGNYDLNVLLHFEGESTQKTYPASVSIDKLRITNPTGLVTGSETSEEGKSSSMLILLLVILVVVNVVGLFFMKKAFSKKK